MVNLKRDLHLVYTKALGNARWARSMVIDSRNVRCPIFKLSSKFPLDYLIRVWWPATVKSMQTEETEWLNWRRPWNKYMKNCASTKSDSWNSMKTFQTPTALFLLRTSPLSSKFASKSCWLREKVIINQNC